MTKPTSVSYVWGYVNHWCSETKRREIVYSIKKKITNIYIVKNIMISLFNDKYDLQLFNVLIEEYLKKYIQ